MTMPDSVTRARLVVCAVKLKLDAAELPYLSGWFAAVFGEY